MVPELNGLIQINLGRSDMTNDASQTMVMGATVMRAIFLGAALLMSLSLGPSLAQDQSPAPNVSRPVQSQPDSRTSGTDPANSRAQNNRVLERTGPGIDWDHRKPGRDWKMAPGHDAGRN